MNDLGNGTIIAALIAFLSVLVGHYFIRPKMLAEAKKAEAEARKAEAEAAQMDSLRLYAEIDRLDRKLADQDAKIEALLERLAAQEKDRQAVAALADEREAENKLLRVKLGRLEKRLRAIEKLFELHPIPDEMRAALAKLDSED